MGNTTFHTRVRNHRRAHKALSVGVMIRALVITGLLLMQTVNVQARSSSPPFHSLQAPSNDAGARAEAALLSLAQTNPNALVRVIVQKTRTAHRRDVAPPQMRDGIMLHDLPIINAFVAQLPARDAIELSRNPGIHWVSLDGPMESTACADCIDTTALTNAYVRAVKADQVWNESPYAQGQGIGVAILDSGVDTAPDLTNSWGQSRVIGQLAVNDGPNQTPLDQFGHGTLVAGIIGGNGNSSNRKHVGIAPKVNLINVKVLDDRNMGAGRASNIVAGMQWILNNKARYNIRVVNISLNYTQPQSYHVDPLCAAAEILWFNGIVVVVSAGNRGNGALYPPANDPFVITVGATDDMGTPSINDDTMAAFSAFGLTVDGISKPDLVAPGRNIVSLNVANSSLATMRPAHIVSGSSDKYFRMSGTSVSAPIVAGAIALLLQREPTLTPDQVKYRLKWTANKSWAGYDAARAGAGYLDIYAATRSGVTTQSMNTGIPVSQLISDARNTTRLYRAINLNGPAVAIDGQLWEDDSAPNLSAGPYRFCDSNVRLTTPTDASRERMIRCSVRVNNMIGTSVELSAVPNRSYQVYLYVWENNFPQTFNLAINGQTVRTNLNIGSAGAWARIGPFPVTVSNGQLRVTTSGGSANLSGIEVYMADGAVGNSRLKINGSKSIVDDGHEGAATPDDATSPPSGGGGEPVVPPLDPPVALPNVIHLPAVSVNSDGNTVAATLDVNALNTQSASVATDSLESASVQATNAATADLIIYEDALAWEDWSWGVNWSNTTTIARSGTSALALTLGPNWSGFSPRAPNAIQPVNAANYAAISFWAYGAPGGNTVRVFLHTRDTDGASVTPSVLVNIPAGKWTQFTIPLSQFGTIDAIARVNFADASGGGQSTLYLDAIRLVSTAVGLPFAWDGVVWNSVSWGSVSWASVSWASVSWASVSWASDTWE
jgi:serine protease AprX